MTTAISALTLDGTLRFSANSLLSLASQIVRLLHTHHSQQRETFLAAGDEDSEVESVENLTDIEILLRELDPVYWKEVADRRLETYGGYTTWTAAELARRSKPETRMSVLFELGRIPKAFWVVPDAVKLWRESRGAHMDGTENQRNEDAQLDLLIFLSEKRARAELFKLVTADGKAQKA